MMSTPLWLLVGVAVVVLGIFGIQLARKWRNAADNAPIKRPPYYE